MWPAAPQKKHVNWGYRAKNREPAAACMRTETMMFPSVFGVLQFWKLSVLLLLEYIDKHILQFSWNQGNSLWYVSLFFFFPSRKCVRPPPITSSSQNATLKLEISPRSGLRNFQVRRPERPETQQGGGAQASEKKEIRRGVALVPRKRQYRSNTEAYATLRENSQVAVEC